MKITQNTLIIFGRFGPINKSETGNTRTVDKGHLPSLR